MVGRDLPAGCAGGSVIRLRHETLPAGLSAIVRRRADGDLEVIISTALSAGRQRAAVRAGLRAMQPARRHAALLPLPALITLAAVVPLGRPGGAVAGLVQRIGLTPEAAHDLQQLLPTDTAVSAATTGIGVVLTVILTVRWPLALQRGYELVWDLPPGGVRGLWRPLAWLAGFAR